MALPSRETREINSKKVKFIGEEYDYCKDCQNWHISSRLGYKHKSLVIYHHYICISQSLAQSRTESEVLIDFKVLARCKLLGLKEKR